MQPNRLSALIAIMAIYSFCAIPSAFAQLSQGSQDTIFIGKLRILPSVEDLSKMQGKELQLKRITESLEVQFETALNATRVFKLVERKQKEEIELEQAYAAVAVDANDKNAAQLLKMAGAKFVFLPQIDGFDDKTRTEKYQQIGKSVTKREVYLSAVVKIVDTTTGVYLPDSPTFQLRNTDKKDSGKFFSDTGGDELFVNMAKEMARVLSQKIVTLLRPAKILKVTGSQILINRGLDAGFKKEDLIHIYATEDIVDEDTGEVFSNEVQVGQARVDRADEKKSFAIIEGDNLGVAAGCVVKVVEFKPKTLIKPANEINTNKQQQKDAEVW